MPNLSTTAPIKVRSTLARALSVEDVNDLGRTTGQAERLRTVTPLRLCLAMLSMLACAKVESLADVLRAFSDQNGVHAAYKVFYNRLARVGFAAFMHGVAGVVVLIASRVERLFERHWLAGGAESGEAPELWSEEAPVLAAVAAALVDGHMDFELECVRRYGYPAEEVAPMTLGPCHDHVNGFAFRAGLVTRAGQRDRLERLYC